MKKLSYKDRFIMDLKRNAEENTCTSYEADIRKFLDVMSKHKGVQDEVAIIRSVTNDDVEDWFLQATSSSGDNYALTTVNRKITSLSLFFEYMKKNKGVIEKNPFEGVSLYKNAEGKIKDMLTIDEVREVLAASYTKHRGDRNFEFVSARMRFMTALMCTTGLRISEVIAIDMNDIEQINDDYMININKEKVKNDINKRVPICGLTKKYYHEYLAERRMLGLDNSDEALMVSHKGSRISRKTAEADIKKYVARAGIDKVINNHSYRHTFRTSLTKRNVNESLICIIGGWSRKNLAMSSIYTHDSIDLDLDKIKVCDFL